METEIFKTIEEFPNYMISNFGNIIKTKSGNQLTKVMNDRGYNQIRFCINGKTYKKKIHRLVANAFIPNPNKLPEINHKDGNKSNNTVSNLEWCTRKQNMEHASKILHSMKWSESRRSQFVSSRKGKECKKKLSKDQINKVIEETRPLHSIMGKWGFTPKLQAIADKYCVHKDTIRKIMINDKKSLTKN